MPELSQSTESLKTDLKPAPVAEELEASELRGTLPVTPEELTRIAASDSAGESDAEALLGQERALDAVRLAIGINAPGYNVFVSGLRTREERAAILQLLQEQAARMPTP